MYNKTGDELSYVSSIGNCSEELQNSLNWHEVIVDKGKNHFIFRGAFIFYVDSMGSRNCLKMVN